MAQITYANKSALNVNSSIADTNKCNASDMNEIKNAVNTNTPVASITMYAGSTVPSGWLLCDGSEVSRTTYANLFNAIGITYGSGDGSTTFNLPNLKGKIIVGQDTNDTSFDTIGETGGEKTHKLTVNEMPKHAHEIPYVAQTQGTSYAGVQGSTTLNWWSASYMHEAGGDQAHNNLQPYVVMNYIISY